MALSLIATNLSFVWFDTDDQTKLIANITAVIVPVIAAGVCGWILLRLLGELEGAYRHSEHLANTDPLTNAPNRRRFTEIALASLASESAIDKPTSLILLDIDDFKQINDRHGHACGDRALQLIATSVRACIRRGDTFARWGGEEFIVLLPETSGNEALVIAEAVRNAIANETIAANERTLKITASAGVVTHHPPARPDLETLINRADVAMYTAKNQGKNRVVVSPPSLATEELIEV